MAGNTKYVFDASAVIASLLPDEKTDPKIAPFLKIISESKNQLFSCHLLQFEFGNSLKSTLLKKRIKPSTTRILIDQFTDLPITYLPIDSAKTLDLATKHKLSFYDASYLFLAKSKRAKLLTLDKKLQRLAA